MKGLKYFFFFKIVLVLKIPENIDSHDFPGACVPRLGCSQLEVALVIVDPGPGVVDLLPFIR